MPPATTFAASPSLSSALDDGDEFSACGDRGAWLWKTISATSLSLLGASLGDYTAWSGREGDGGSDNEGDAVVA